MARLNDAQKALKVLAANSEAILEAHLNRGNRIPETPENQGLLDTLKHHRLILSIGDEEPQLRKVLVQLLGHISESDRRRWASQHVDKLWDELVDLFEQYRQAKAKAATADQERLEDDIKDVLSGLIEDIRTATDTFAGHINSGFSYVTDLELRIRENERVIERAGRLIALFDSFNIMELAEHAGSDPFLRRLLLNYLPATLEEGRKNLSYALNQLRLLLVRLREDQRLNKLIGSFEAHFFNNPGFEPSIDHLDLEACPSVLNTVAPFRMMASPDVYDPIDDEPLIELAANARAIPLDTPRATKPNLRVDSVQFDVDGVVVEEPVDPVSAMVENLIQYILDGDIGTGEIRALDVLEESDLEIGPEDWLATLSVGLSTLTTRDRELIDVQHHSVPDPVFVDNLLVYDITLRAAADVSR